MNRRSAARAAAGVAVTLGGLLAGPTVALADPAGPTDYRSEVTAVDPPSSQIDVGIVGGDSFVQLTVQPGVHVVVVGYAGEPYLLIDLTGQVFENRRSPATYYNQERYGADIPATADASAPPEWRRVGTGGSWAWHDHRAHRMEEYPPLNARRGEQVLDNVIPLVVDGQDVDVHVASTWMPAPSRAPMIVGSVAGLALVAVPVLVGRRRDSTRSGTMVAAPLAGIAAVAAVIGTLQFRSLPASTDPLVLWWLAPGSALAFAVGAIVVQRRSTEARFRQLAVPAASAVAGAQLFVWGFERRAGLVRAVLPTEVPYWLDRAVTAGALVAGALGTLAAIAALLDAPRSVVLTTLRSGPRRSPA